VDEDAGGREALGSSAGRCTVPDCQTKIRSIRQTTWHSATCQRRGRLQPRPVRHEKNVKDEDVGGTSTNLQICN